MIRIIIYTSCLLAAMTAPLTGSAVPLQDRPLTITGRILQNNDQRPVEFASVLAKDHASDVLVAGATSAADGRFEIKCTRKDFYIEVRFIGFTTLLITDFKAIDGHIDLGDILLEEDSKTLGEVVIEGEKSQTEFKLDKRVFNVGQDLSSTGASALEVLNRVPSVRVSIEGQISLRGSDGVRILVNGKPTVLANEQGNALGTLTADMIEKIEVITNPSAKYDAEGTAGIINIVLKKEEKKGINGAVTANTGFPNNHSVGFSLNRRTEKFNLFTQAGIGYRTYPEKQRMINQDLTDGSAVESSGERKKNEGFYNLILGTDYHINSSNMLSLSGHLAYEKETEEGILDYRALDGEGNTLASWRRSEVTSAGNPKWAYDFQYEKTFSGNKEHQLLITALGNFFAKDQQSEFTNELISGTEAGAPDQRTETDFKEAEYTFKADYTWPIAHRWKLESGLQYLLTDVGNDYSISRRGNGEWENIVALTNVFEMDQHVAAAYALGQYEREKFGAKLGLRLENTVLNTLLINTNEQNHRQYLDAFPTAHTSYKFTKKISLQAGYSRRIYRPGLWELNPFYNMQNNFSIDTGNPDLLPEYTDVIEVTGIFNWNTLSMNVGINQRFTRDEIEEISRVVDKVSITMPMNAGTENITGVELNAKYSPLDWLSASLDFNYNYLSRKGEVDSYSFDFNTSLWESRVTTRLKLPASFDIEVVGNYYSPYKSVQGRTSENVSADLGMRKKIAKGKAILNLSVRDVFASSIWETVLQQDDFYLYDRSRMGRFVTFGISFGFGKGEAMEFSGQKMF